MDRELHKQFKRLIKIENKILNKKDNQLFKSKIATIMDKFQGKIPETLKLTLERAFLSSFQLVFTKGHVYIEKTYNKDKIQLEHDLNDYAINKKFTKKNIKKLDKQANQSQMLNSSLTILEGGMLGFLGIGLPDIPLFISVIMKTIYEIALSYGYDYESDEERVYILLIICGAMTSGNKQKAYNERLDQLANQIDKQLECEINLEEHLKMTAEVLSDAMLTAKFIQGIPVIGVVGGVVNYNIIKKIGKYAAIKYKKRYLIKKARQQYL
jgi:hypothetical protein